MDALWLLALEFCFTSEDNKTFDVIGGQEFQQRLYGFDMFIVLVQRILKAMLAFE